MQAVVPSIRVTIPHALRSLCAGQAELCLVAENVRGLLTRLAQEHSQIHSKLCDERGEPRPHINVFVNSDHIRTRAGLDTPLAEGDLVSILPAVSGG
ncbi:MAG TPA: MoaD/ThiS family protein [Pirellulales bacterium]|jgi:molybdopterin converting factor small subunit|nr:MoaD/ThiS family protein [Pirellulales bacterium]